MRGSGAVRNVFVLGFAFWSWRVGLNKPPCNWHANSRNQLVKSKDKGKEKHKIKRNTQTLKHPWRKLRVIIIWASFSVFTFDNCIIKFSQNGTATKRAASMLLTIIADAMPGKRKYRRKEVEKFEIICIRAEHASNDLVHWKYLRMPICKPQPPACTEIKSQRIRQIIALLRSREYSDHAL